MMHREQNGDTNTGSSAPGRTTAEGKGWLRREEMLCDCCAAE